MRRRVGLGDVADDLRRRDPVGQERERHRRVVAGLHVEPAPVDRPCRRAAAACRSSAGRARSRARARSATGRATAPRRPARPGSFRRRYGSGRRETCRWSARPARPRMLLPSPSAMPQTRPAASSSRSSAAPSTISRVSISARMSAIARRYSLRSAWARGPRTAGPLLRFSMRNWMPARSIARPMTPSSASISRTRWPLREPADRRVARHLADRRARMRQQRRARAEPRRRRRRLAPGMPAADHDDVVDPARFLHFHGARI